MPIFNIMPKNLEMFSARLDRLLEQKHMLQKELASLCGISQNTISTWKATGRLPRADIAVKIARTVGVSTEYLISGEEAQTCGDDLAAKVAGLSPEKRRVVQAVVDALDFL